MAKQKYWRDDNSVEAARSTEDVKAKARRNRRQFEDDQRAMETWAAGGFTSQYANDRDNVVVEDEEEL